MNFNQETPSEDQITSERLLADSLFSIFDNFNTIAFNQEKASFILQNLGILLIIEKLSYTKKNLHDWVKNTWKETYNENKEFQIKNFLVELSKFVSDYFDPIFSENDFFSLLEQNEENFRKVHTSFDFIITELAKQTEASLSSVIETLFDGYNSFFKVKKEFIYPKVSPVLTKSLLHNSLQLDLEKILEILRNLKLTNNEQDKNLFLNEIMNYRILDPISLTGNVLTDCISNLNDFYVELVSILREESFSFEIRQSICEELFGIKDPDIPETDLLRIIITRHLFAIVPDQNLLFGNKLQIFLSVNELAKEETLVRLNLSFNIVKGNLLLGFPYKEGNLILQSSLNQEGSSLSNESYEQVNNLFKKLVLTGESYEELSKLKKNLLYVVGENYRKNIQDLKIKSDIYANLHIIHIQAEFFFLRFNDELKFSLVANVMPIRQKLSISQTKIVLKQYYTSDEDTIDVINIYCNLFMNFINKNGRLALLSSRSILYHSEYTHYRETILKSTTMNLLVDIGDIIYQKIRNSFGLLILENRAPENIHKFKGFNLVSIDLDKKEQLLLDLNNQDFSDEKAIIREISQNEFLMIQGFRFYIKKPSKWFENFSSMPNVLGEYIESIEDSVKIGENKVFVIAESKAKQLQLEQPTLPYGLKGKDFNRYSIPESKVVIRVPSEYDEEEKIAEEFPNTWKYLLENKEYLEDRPQVKKGTSKWYEFADHDKVTEKSIKPPKLLIKEKSNEPVAVFDTKGTIQLSSTLALRFTKQVKFRDYFKVLVWFNSLVVKAGYQDLTQDTKSDAVISKESLKNLYFPIAILRDDMLTSNVQQIVQMCLANKFSFNPHLLIPEYGEGQFHPEVYQFLFNKIYEVLKKKMSRFLDTKIKLEDIVIITISQENKKKKVDFDYLCPIIQDYAKGILVLQDGDIEITMKLKPRQAYTLPFLQLFLAYQPQEMIVEYLKQYTKPEPLETIIGNWPIPELQMKHVMETYNFVRFQRQNYTNFFNRTKNMLIKVEKLIAGHYGFTPEEIDELLADRELIES